ncbi:MAG: hypothetical protein ACI9FJ_002960, partial [Alteromonadaceae bacterium]
LAANKVCVQARPWNDCSMMSCRNLPSKTLLLKETTLAV